MGILKTGKLQFLYSLAVIVPLQLLCTWYQGHKFLSPYLYLFSIYQNLQYVPVIFVSAFLIAFCRLWQLSEHNRIVLLILAPIMGIYVAASMSVLAILMLLAGLLGFAFYQLKNFSDKIPAIRNIEKPTHHHISLPGILAFCFYPGSYLFLFGCMFILAVIAAAIEMSVFKLGGQNPILCSLLAQVVAYRYSSFGYVPGQSYLLFGSIYFNLFIIYFANKFLVYWHNRAVKT